MDFILLAQNSQEPLTGIPDITTTCCLMIIGAIIIGLILAVVFKALIEFLPATVLALAVWWLTGSIIYGLITFGVVALIMLIVDRNR